MPRRGLDVEPRRRGEQEEPHRAADLERLPADVRAVGPLASNAPSSTPSARRPPASAVAQRPSTRDHRRAHPARGRGESDLGRERNPPLARRGGGLRALRGLRGDGGGRISSVTRSSSPAARAITSTRPGAPGTSSRAFHAPAPAAAGADTAPALATSVGASATAFPAASATVTRSATASRSPTVARARAAEIESRAGRPGGRSSETIEAIPGSSPSRATALTRAAAPAGSRQLPDPPPARPPRGR